VNEEKRQLLEEWLRDTKLRRATQYLSAVHCRRQHLRLGIPVIIFSTLVGSSVFATLNADTDEVSICLKITLGLVALTSAVLAALQTFLRFPEQAERFSVANRTYNRLEKEIEQLIAFPPSDEVLEKAVDDLRQRIDNAIDQAPPALEHVWRRVRDKPNRDLSSDKKDGITNG